MSNKQYYTNLNPNEKVIENRFGSKVVMDNSGNVLLTTSRRTEYIDQLRQEDYQGNIDLSPDEEGSFFYVGTGQVDVNQQGNINQDTVNPTSNNFIFPEFGASSSAITMPSYPTSSQTKDTLPSDEASYDNSAWLNSNGDNGEGSGFEGTISPEQLKELNDFFYNIDNII
jgi:hypothetical protein